MAVYVAAVWSHAHNAWAEFVVSSDAAKVRAVCAPLCQFTATHVRIVRVARDDWDLIRPALARLGVPPKSYTPKELEMFCDHRREVGGSILAAFDDDAAFVERPAVGRRSALN